MFNASDLTFGPGATVPHSGIYAVVHGKPHESYHEVFIEGGTFPHCGICTHRVTFRLILPICHIAEDEDFKLNAGSRKSA